MIIKLRDKREGLNVRSTVFVGPDEDGLHSVGELLFRFDEYRTFVETLCVAYHAHVKVIVPDYGHILTGATEELEFHANDGEGTDRSNEVSPTKTADRGQPEGLLLDEDGLDASSDENNGPPGTENREEGAGGRVEKDDW